MSVPVVMAACGVGAGAAALAALGRPPARRLAPRVRPYAVVERTALGHAPDVPRQVRPLRSELLDRAGRALESRGDEHVAKLLRQAGMHDLTPADFRARQVLTSCAWAAGAATVVAVTLRTPVFVLLAVVAGFVYGSTRVRRNLDRRIAERATRIRLELYTVNHLLAMHVRTGAGAMQAVQRVVDRGHGAVVEELGDVLVWARSGMGEAEAFRRAAALTPEPSAARTYQLLAAGVERGADLGRGLLALSADIRDSRREQLHKEAVRRRAAMLIPTIAILAPIMLLFIAAPLPSIVFGHH
jgi:Flp pilus assembly protein TadB